MIAVPTFPVSLKFPLGVHWPERLRDTLRRIREGTLGARERAMLMPQVAAGGVHGGINAGAVGVAQVVPTKWWQAGGATGCVAAYQPKGAASLAASYVNLANPGTNDATLGSAPAWDVTNGWDFHTAPRYLRTGFTDSAIGTVLVRFSNATNSGDTYLFGTNKTTNEEYWIAPRNPNYVRIKFARYARADAVSAKLTTGVLAMAGRDLFVNGVFDSTCLAGAASGLECFIGRLNNNGSPYGAAVADIQAIAFYTGILSAAQVLALSTAMAAL